MKMVFRLMALMCLIITSTTLATTVRYQHTDMLGSVVAESDANGNIISRSHYEPFGKRLEGNKKGIGYTGHLHDKDLNLTYMQARYYDPLIGRFYSNDPVDTLGHIKREAALHGFNRYTYAYNNPLKYTDPDGKAPDGSYLNRPMGVSVKQHQSSSTTGGALNTTLGAVAVVGCAVTPCGPLAAGVTAIGLTNGLAETNVVSEALQAAGTSTETADGIASAVDLATGGKGQLDNVTAAAKSLFTGTADQVGGNVAKTVADAAGYQATVDENLDKIDNVNFN